ncbi:MAG: alpha/beta fold hydrolase [Bacteroidota bacterium]
MPHATVNRTQLYYERTGAGSPPLVFVHGFGCAHEDWQPQVDAFGTRHMVITCDLRGHGASPGEPESCSIETYGADVAALLRALNLSGAVLVGHSMGTRVVLQACLDAPDRVAGLVLVDGSFMAAAGERAEEDARRAIASAGYAAWAGGLFEQMFFAPSAAADRIRARAERLPEAVGAALFPRMVGWDARKMAAALGRVGVPLLVIQSTMITPDRRRIPLAPGANTPWLDMVRSRAPHAAIEVVPGVAHFTMLEAPDTVNRLLADFVARIAPGR